MSRSDADPPALRMNTALKRVGMALVPILLVLLAWYLIATIISAVRDVPFPTPFTTGARLAEFLSKATGLVKKAMARHSYTLTLDKSTFKSLEQTARFLESKRRIKEIPDLGKALDTRYLQQAR